MHPVILLFFCLAALTLSSASFAADKEPPFRADSGLTKTEYLLSAGQFSAALETAEDVLARHPNNADAYTYRGYAYYRLGETAAAVKDFRRALELEPTHLGANKYLADVYLEAGKVGQALEQMQVIRMTCGHRDCEELRSLASAIDKYKRGKKPEKEIPEEKK
jgi:tetratricopeptide (TPR) repeat protein